ncbi:Tannase/feruloyl esterase [Microdochium trichocladiopsis]|uniref:Carboxylic ester hydrolase n=1 Tax=Microdochium trichocladiopsis TaxID=1682393 RepID=A0A9P8YDF4_9PEZI|nr:Tannase/feruloyl esterase [Microdochium trichocladiopsis]KAH7035994.1 Tannase/feruloyl esterase [Microdochium trichocladiopsis]
MKQRAVTAPGLLLGATVSQGFQTADDCKALAGKLQFPNTTILSTSFVQAGTNLTYPNNDPTCLRSQVSTSPICRVQLFTTTSPISNVTLEAWLPLQSAWSGRLLGTGNGGLGGCIKYDDLNYAAKNGFAAIGTNNGHNGNQGKSFYKNLEVWEDYVSRAVHLEAGMGKSLVQQAYGKPHTKAYYMGCSTGGRQGFKEAQRYPGDFDGILAGAPAIDLNALQYATASAYKILGPKGEPTWLTPAQWELVYADVNALCDELDGAKDGILEDPTMCKNYQPERLLCGPGETAASNKCITPVQAAAVRSIYSDIYGTNGTFIYPRMTPGANATSSAFNGSPPPYPVDGWKYVYADPSWDINKLNPTDMDTARAFDESTGLDAATFQGDLSAARDAGVKILHWHGQADPIISSDNSVRYYNHVANTMNARVQELDQFYRFFRVSGTAHCNPGLGASLVGGGANTATAFEPADGNMLASLVRWVEKGVAPEYILGKKLGGGPDGSKVVLQRRHCKYPKRNVHKGPGPIEDANSWRCV